MTDYRTRLRALAADLERFDLWGGTRSQSDAEDLRSLLSEADRLRALVDVATGGLMLLGQADDGYKNEGKGRFCDGYAESRCGMAEAARSLLTKLKGEGQ